MRSASDSIAQLASALAKAQIDLVNPPKTLTGMIDRWGTGNEGQSYRYASLSAGLEIVRQTLCKHELAVIQTTHVDRDSAMVLLTTTLAHGSGEWIAALWPVCRIGDMTNPKLMGAALTYARRYGLFTLVGIAGDDDLDAPDLPRTDFGNVSEDAPISSPKPDGKAARDERLTAARDKAPVSSPSSGTQPLPEAGLAAPAGAGAWNRRTELEVNIGDESDHDPGYPVREADAGARYARGRGRRFAKAAPRQRLRIFSDNPLRDLHDIEDSDGLFRWALAILPLRNKLPEAARDALDAAFLAKANHLQGDADVDPQPRQPPNSPALPSSAGP